MTDGNAKRMFDREELDVPLLLPPSLSTRGRTRERINRIGETTFLSLSSHRMNSLCVFLVFVFFAPSLAPFVLLGGLFPHYPPRRKCSLTKGIVYQNETIALHDVRSVVTACTVTSESLWDHSFTTVLVSPSQCLFFSFFSFTFSSLFFFVSCAFPLYALMRILLFLPLSAIFSSLRGRARAHRFAVSQVRKIRYKLPLVPAPLSPSTICVCLVARERFRAQQPRNKICNRKSGCIYYRVAINSQSYSMEIRRRAASSSRRIDAPPSRRGRNSRGKKAAAGPRCSPAIISIQK